MQQQKCMLIQENEQIDQWSIPRSLCRTMDDLDEFSAQEQDLQPIYAEDIEENEFNDETFGDAEINETFGKSF